MLPTWLQKILESKSQEFFHEHKEVLLDIILFGSTVQGKKNPSDLDLIIVFHRKKDLQLSYELRKLLEKSTKLTVDITAKSYAELFDINFTAREALLSEGYSLINKIFLSAGWGYGNMGLFTYKLQGKTKSERMRFYYSLYGRNTAAIGRHEPVFKLGDFSL